MSIAQKPESGPVIHDWRPEDPAFWGASGKKTANRNLWISIPALLQIGRASCRERVS